MSECSACKKAMSDLAVVCPHCGTRQKDRDPVVEKPPPKKLTNLTKEETAALLFAHGADKIDVDAPKGLAAVLLPHPASAGWVRGLEMVCLIVSVPALACGAPYLLMSLRFLRRVNRMSSANAHFGTALLGAGGLYFSLAMTNVTPLWTWTIVLVSSGALAIRGLIHRLLT